MQKPHPPVLVGGEGPGAERRVLDYGDEWMPHAGMPVHLLFARIATLRQAARAAGRQVAVPVTLFGADPDRAALQALRDNGVNRAVLYAPPADADTVVRFLDQAALLRSAVSD
jgi:alkanesulfonate monooxygenase SsuD/methylene tetrahydromethanopterin reductase-like flavin-dependent oxidoreductase (luciferase family)